MGANDVQVGGQHYTGPYQHWDWAIDVRLGYLDGNASKYVARWRKKNGVEDLDKADHYLDKKLETGRGPAHNRLEIDGITQRTHRFAESNFLHQLEEECLLAIAVGDYHNAKLLIKAIRNAHVRGAV